MEGKCCGSKIDRLPDDILWGIVMFLGIDIGQKPILSLISQKWYIFLNKSKYNDIFYRILCVMPTQNIIHDEFYFIGLSNCTKLRQLDIRFNNEMQDFHLSYLSNLTLLERLFLPSNTTDYGLLYLTSLRNLYELDASYIRYIGDGLKYLSQLPKLTTLTLFRSRIRDESFKHISEIQTLTDLGLSFCQKITDTGIKYIESLTNLETLMIASMNITQLNFLSTLTNIKTLDINNLQKIQHEVLSSLTKLVVLDISNNGLNDNDLKFLPYLSNLTYLNLSNNTITDNGLQNLSNLINISILDLNSCDTITGSGLKYLPSSNLTELSFKYTSSEKSVLNINFNNLISLDLLGRSFLESDMNSLSNLTSLKNISISGFDEILPRFDSLTNLTKIVLHKFKCITDEFCLTLNKLVKLDILILEDVKISNHNLYKLEGCHFRKLELKSCDFSNIILDNIFNKMGQLEIFQLINILRITDDGLKFIRNLTRLQTFKISSCRLITIEGIKYLTQLTTLHDLSLNNLELQYNEAISLFPPNVNIMNYYY